MTHMPDSINDHLDILLVEDDALTVALLEHLLRRHGHQVTVASDGQRAWDMIQSRASAPDLVLLDLMLPYIDGYELLQLMRAQPAWQRTPVVVLSAKSQEEDVVRSFELGATDYVTKPFRAQELLARVRRQVQIARMT